MTITEALETILNARYGREVRQAIHDGIKQAYDDAISNGHADMEVSQARGNYPTLAERLIADFNNLNSDKISKGKVEASDLMQSVLDIIDKKIAKGQVTMADLTQEVREVLNGDRPLPIVGKDSVIGYENIVDGTVTVKNTDFISTSTNLIDVTKLKSGLLNSSGEYTTASDYLYLPEGIPCVPSTAYSHVGITHMTYFKANGEFFNRLTILDTPTFTTPPNVVRMVPNIQTSRDLSEIQLNEGGNLLPYEPFYKELDEDIKLANNTISTGMLKDKSVSKDKTDFIVRSKANLLDVDRMRSGYYDSTGSYTPSATYITNNDDYFIEVNPNTDYTIPVDNYTTNNSSVFLWYTAEKVLIRRDLGTSNYAGYVEGFTSKSPVNARFLKINLGTHYNINLENACLFKGDRLLNSFEISGNFEEPKKETTKNYKFSISKVFGDFPEVELPGIGEIDSPFSSRTVLHDEVYEAFDGLMAEETSYISRNKVGTSTLGKPIYEYYFSPESGAITSGPDSPYPTIILISSIHGGEDLSTYTLYHVMDMITRKWTESDTLEYLRHYVNIRVVPLPNPDDFDTRSYVGLNDINLNRDFDINWKVQTGAHTGPNQRTESSIMQNYLNNNNDAICFVDCHVRGHGVTDDQLMWMESLAEYDTPIPKDTIETMTRKWKVKYPNLKAIDGQLGYATAVAGGKVGGSGTIDSYGHFVAGVNNILWEGFKSSNSITEAYGSQVMTMNAQYLGQTILSVIKNYQ